MTTEKSENEKRIWFSGLCPNTKWNFFCSFFPYIQAAKETSDKGKKDYYLTLEKGPTHIFWDLGDFDSKWASTKVWVKTPPCRDEQTQCQKCKKPALEENETVSFRACEIVWKRWIRSPIWQESCQNKISWEQEQVLEVIKCDCKKNLGLHSKWLLQMPKFLKTKYTFRNLGKD